MDSNEGLITIAVPTYDRPEALRRCVAELLRQWTPEFPVLRAVQADRFE